MEWIFAFVQSYIQRNMALFIVVLVVLLVRLLMKRMPKKYVYCLWAIVGIRMLFSVPLASPVSIYQFFPWADPLLGTVQVALRDDKEQLSGEAQNVAEANPFSEVRAGMSGEGIAGEPGKVNSSAGFLEPSKGDALLMHGNGAAIGSTEAERKADPQENALDGETKLTQDGMDQAQGSLAGMDPSFDAAIGLQDPSEDQPALNADDAFHGQTTSELLQGQRQLAERERQKTRLSEEEAFLAFAGGQVAIRTRSVIALFTVWMIGFFTVLGIGVVSYARIRRLVKEAVHLKENVWECDNIATPFVFGILRPRIFVPFHLEEEKRCFALEHERQHLKNLDPFTRLLAYVLLAVYWMNPLVWIAYFCFVRDQEMRCDEAVLFRLGAEHKKEYGMTLLAFATEEHFVGFSPVALGESDAEKRIKNVLNYKKPGFWMILACIAILICIGIVCLTTAGKNEKTNDGTEQAGTEQSGSEQAFSSVDETKQGAEPLEEKLLYESSVSADLDGDGEKELIQIKDYASGKTTLETKINGKSIKEHAMQSVQMIKTDCVAADLTGDGREELITLQSTLLASTYNWPGKVTVLQVENGEWREFSDELFYPEAGEYVYQEYYPKKITDSICISVKIELASDGANLHLTYPTNDEVSHGMGGVLRIDCTYRETKDGWDVHYVLLSHDYMKEQARVASGTHEIYSISVGYAPGEAVEAGKETLSRLFSGLPLHYFETATDEFNLSLTMEEGGSFTGTDVSNGNGNPQTQICEFTGQIANLRKVNDLQYVFSVEDLSYPDPDQITKQNGTQFVTVKPFGMEEGDEFLLYLPGYPVTNLPSLIIQSLEDAGQPTWYQYSYEILPCYVLWNLEKDSVYTSFYVNEYVGQRMETIGLYGDLSYPCGKNGGFSEKSVARLCADACGTFVQKVKYPNVKAQEFTAFTRNEQLADYLEYKTRHFPHAFSDGDWVLEIKQWDPVTIGNAKVLHVTGIPKYRNAMTGTLFPGQEHYGARGSWGIIHFLIDTEDGQLYIRDWYWDTKDSRDISLRGSYSVEEAYDFWNHPVEYRSVVRSEAVKIGDQVTVMGLSVTCKETVSKSPNNPAQYNRKYYYDGLLVGESLSYGDSMDYADDLDDDGVTEIICSIRELYAQNYEDVMVYRRKGNVIYLGRLNHPGLLELENCDDLSAERRITKHYDPEKHLLYVKYPVRGGDYASVPFTYDDMTFVEFTYLMPSNWKEAYANYASRSDDDTFDLLYLDDDEIPELYVASLVFGGQKLISYHDGKLVEKELNGLEMLYLEKKGVFYLFGGNNGYFPAEVHQLKDGEFSLLGSGYQKKEYIANEYADNPDHVTEFDSYDWNGQSVTKEQYYQNIDALIPRKEAIFPKQSYRLYGILLELGLGLDDLADG
ncbi:MAG: M56 family metallopeptidase [Lachnospiraceae bacterium]|nr:M56 family metallopeptidase [Lachnospiraceae bacterium]MBR4606895.1 M56 family metallopeptidase [Lachnospiraceae bacterium]